MRVLAIDTALGACAAAVFDSAQSTILAAESLPMTRGHAEALLPLLARVIDQSRLEFRDLDRIAVTVGPGSFTGVRVGISAARGLALASGRPAVGLSTFAAYAAPHVRLDEDVATIAVIDARHGRVYMQAFGHTGKTLLAPRIATIRDAIRALRGGPARIVGSAADLIAEQLPPGEPAPLLVQADPAPAIEWVARLGAAAEETSEPPRPLYLAEPDAKPQGAARLPRA